MGHPQRTDQGEEGGDGSGKDQQENGETHEQRDIPKACHEDNRHPSGVEEAIGGILGDACRVDGLFRSNEC